MGIPELLKTAGKPRPEEEEASRSTVWGEHLDPENVLPEYPRPSFVRPSHISLNGIWRYAVTKTPDMPSLPQGNILVPFSPESRLSGVDITLQPDEYLWYFKTLPQMKAPSKGARLLLHFGAVDQIAEVYVNGEYQCTHVGGYLPFTVDITDALIEEDAVRKNEPEHPLDHPTKNRLVVRVQDTTDTSWHARGRQSLAYEEESCPAQSGIWQSVWLEWVPACYIRALSVTPHDDLFSVSLRLETSVPAGVEVVVYDDNDKPFTKAYCSTSKAPEEEYPINLCKSGSDTKPCNKIGGGCYVAGVRLLIENARLWTPEDPYLYRMSLRVGQDTVVTYFALRSFSVKPDEQGIPRFYLNNSRVFLNGVLDRGYWPESLMSAPSDKALIYDITQMKRLGFNMIRKSGKVECARFYYHCDRLGMLVFQDIVSGGGAGTGILTTVLPALFPGLFGALRDGTGRYQFLGRADREGREQWENELCGTIGHLYNSPGVCCYVLFDEGKGQFDAERLTQVARSFDASRLIVQASGWFDRGGGDFRSIHSHGRKVSAEPDRNGRALLLTTFDGYARHAGTVRALKEQGLAGAVCAQVSDTGHDRNGLMRSDRKALKPEVSAHQTGTL